MQAVGRDDVYPDEAAVQTAGDASGSAHELFAAGCAGHGHDDSLACLPRVGDAVGLHVALEVLLDAVRHPQELSLIHI